MTSPAPGFLRIDGLAKAYGGTVVVKGASFSFGRGEFISLLGPSGCGKTTILRMIAGFEAPTAGTILIDGEDVTRLRPNQRRLGMVFQAYALFPNMNVADNIGFGLKVMGMPAEQRRARVDEMLKLIGLAGFDKRYPYEMSGGQQQRVALARALAPRPRLLLLDEPLSALDAKIRVSLREEIRTIQRELGITTIFVTHDQEEALSISDRIVVMNAGHIEQVGTAFEIYNQPQTRFVAGFVGTLNLMAGKVEDAQGGIVRLNGRQAQLARLPDTARSGGDITLAIRPEAVSLVGGHAAGLSFEGVVKDVAFLGAVVRLKVDIGDTRISLDTFNDRQAPPPAPGERVTIGFDGRDLLALAD